MNLVERAKVARARLMIAGSITRQANLVRLLLKAGPGDDAHAILAELLAEQTHTLKASRSLR